jgi:hypothetical protein
MSALNLVHAFAPISALAAFLLAGAGTGTDVPMKPEQADGYPGNPTKPFGSLMQDYTSIKLTPKAGGHYELKLGPAADAPGFPDVDLRPFVPRVPALAKGEATLTRIALMQREFNRNETKLGPVGDFAESKLANNCLRCGMWEVVLEKKKDDGTTGMKYHGWFEFPKEEYAKVFEEANGVKFADYEKSLAQYPAMGGFPVPLEKLRTVVKDQEVTKFDLHLADKPDQLPEQKRKAHLLLNQGIATYADFVDAKRQPITTAKFSEPGYYDPKDPVKFDLAWLAHPKSIHLREVKGVADPVAMGEIELVYENGNRLLIGDADLGKAAPLAKAPEKDGDVLRLTFGIGTPDIYATLAERTAEFTSGRANYLMLLDAKGNHLDNHATGIDRVFIYRSGTGAGELNLLLVGYERIAIVGHVSFAAATP